MKKSHLFTLYFALLSGISFHATRTAAGAGADELLSKEQELVKALNDANKAKALELVADEAINIAAAKDSFNNTALHIAAKEGWNEVVDRLMQRSDLDDFLNAIELFDNTAVSLAGKRGNTAIVQTLIEHGANSERLISILKYVPVDQRAPIKRILQRNNNARGRFTKAAR